MFPLKFWSRFIAESVRIPVVVTNQVRTKVIAERELRPPVLQHGRVC